MRGRDHDVNYDLGVGAFQLQARQRLCIFLERRSWIIAVKEDLVEGIPF
jgi:hypothetical protein